VTTAVGSEQVAPKTKLRGKSEVGPGAGGQAGGGSRARPHGWRGSRARPHGWSERSGVSSLAATKAARRLGLLALHTEPPSKPGLAHVSRLAPSLRSEPLLAPSLRIASALRPRSEPLLPIAFAAGLGRPPSLRSAALLMFARQEDVGEARARRTRRREMRGPPLPKEISRAAVSRSRPSRVPVRARRNRRNWPTITDSRTTERRGRLWRGGTRCRRVRVPPSVTRLAAPRGFRPPRDRPAPPFVSALIAIEGASARAWCATRRRGRRDAGGAGRGAEDGESPFAGLQTRSYNMGWKGKKTKLESPTLQKSQKPGAQKVGEGGWGVCSFGSAGRLAPRASPPPARGSSGRSPFWLLRSGRSPFWLLRSARSPFFRRGFQA